MLKSKTLHVFIFITELLYMMGSLWFRRVASWREGPGFRSVSVDFLYEFRFPPTFQKPAVKLTRETELTCRYRLHCSAQINRMAGSGMRRHSGLVGSTSLGPDVQPSIRGLVIQQDASSNLTTFLVTTVGPLE